MSKQDGLQLRDTIEALLEDGRDARVRALLADLHPTDLAILENSLDEDDARKVFALLDTETASDVLAEIDEPTRHDLLDDMSATEVAEYVHAMPPDEAADVVAELEVARSAAVLEQLPDEESSQIATLLAYPEDSAGGIMNPEVVTVPLAATVGEAVSQISEADIEEEHFYCYVVDRDNRLQGIAPIRRMLTSRQDRPIREILREDVASVHVDTDQEEVARAFSRYNLVSMPVVSDDGRLLGRITIDDIVDVLEAEATEDAFVAAGTDPEEQASDSSFRAARYRLVWMLSCMFITFATGAILTQFTGHGPTAAMLALFVPAIMAMGGNSGVQTATVVVRNIATGRYEGQTIRSVLGRELRVGLLVATSCGVLIGIVSWLWLGRAEYGLVVAMSMFWAVSFAAFLGGVLPFFFRKIGVDPAVACGPIITTTNDVISISIYLGIAAMLIRLLGITS